MLKCTCTKDVFSLEDLCYLCQLEVPGDLPGVTCINPRLPHATTLTVASHIALNRLAVEGIHGRGWYQNSAKHVRALAKTHGLSSKLVADVCAITSPRVQVARNWAITMGISERLASGQSLTQIATSYPGLLTSVRASLRHYDTTGQIRGPKTGPFAKALLGNPDALVLDIWMARALRIPQALLGRAWVRAVVVPHCELTAAKLGMPVAEWQASVWTAMFQQENGAGTASASILGVK